jgi:hypothetical protein
MSERAQNIVFVVLIAAALALAIFAALLLSGRFISDSTEGSAPRPAHKQPPEPPPPPPPPPPAPRPVTTAAAKQQTPAAAAVRVQIDASRGDCWVVAHTGSATGPVLLERIVREGETVTLRARRVYLELGAAGNVDVQVNGRARTIPSGTTDVVLG